MPKIIAICGPTASGKTKYAIEVAKAIGGEIISCDSMQVYKNMDIGSAKPTPEECAAVPHHLVDEIDPREEFTVADYYERAAAYISDISRRGLIPVIEGGTGLYLNSLIYEMDFGKAEKDENLRASLWKEAELNGPEFLHEKLRAADPEAAERIHPNNVKKVIRALEGAVSGNPIADFGKLEKRNPDFDILLIGLSRDRVELYDRINRRVDQMVRDGLFEEVKNLLASGLTEDDISMKGIGYKEIIGYFRNQYSKEEAVELTKKNTRHLAKRQVTWFRRYEDMHRFDITDENDRLAEIIALAEDFLKD